MICDICIYVMYLFSEEENWELLLWPHSKMCKTGITTDCCWTHSEMWFTTKWMSTGCTVKCDPGAMLSNGAEEVLFIVLL